jgi:hypothetical protein
MPQPDYRLLNLTFPPLSVVNVRCSVFKAALDASKYVLSEKWHQCWRIHSVTRYANRNRTMLHVLAGKEKMVGINLIP